MGPCKTCLHEDDCCKELGYDDKAQALGGMELGGMALRCGGSMVRGRVQWWVDGRVP